uniref:Uncharacterized protein n=1 Tax=Kalanchoe fedtschenkoi TaxID=63787 RepID=A0A7N0TVC2_KALFE
MGKRNESTSRGNRWSGDLLHPSQFLKGMVCLLQLRDSSPDELAPLAGIESFNSHLVWIQPSSNQRFEGRRRVMARRERRYYRGATLLREKGKWSWGLLS